MSIIQIGSTLFSPCSIANIFGNWLNGVDCRFKRLIRVGALAVIWSLWLCRNDKVFNDKNSSLMQVIYRTTATLRLWSPLQRVEHRDLFTGVCTSLEGTARDFLSQHGWQHNLRIGPPPPQTCLHFLILICNPSVFSFHSYCLEDFGCVHLSYAEAGCNT